MLNCRGSNGEGTATTLAVDSGSVPQRRSPVTKQQLSKCIRHDSYFVHRYGTYSLIVFILVTKISTFETNSDVFHFKTQMWKNRNDHGQSRIFFTDPPCLWYPFLILLQFISHKCLAKIGCKWVFDIRPKIGHALGPGRRTGDGTAKRDTDEICGTGDEDVWVELELGRQASTGRAAMV